MKAALMDAAFWLIVGGLLAAVTLRFFDGIGRGPFRSTRKEDKR